ncbi:hypothetical protein SCHPADRAFT_933140 [Schizopora paradoxa]|uniref:F-box domain-containing protein n=1 Tax=Schizopora paradoxa TaxID=27342 RepID=A0A0H2RA21_9AGAM|nr:hypothetical protein SCHPADRAFT_933140 [Schizopora paradoxa]
MDAPLRLDTIKLKYEALEVLRELERTADLVTGTHPEITFEVEDWRAGKNYRKLQESGGLDATEFRQLMDDRKRMEFMQQILQNLSTSASELLDIYSHQLDSLSMKLSRGINSLPNELLSHIFHLAYHSSSDRTLLATRLSHVSRTFRSIVLGDHRFWSTVSLYPDTTEETLGKRISRSGSDTDLHVVVKYKESISASAFHAFVDLCSPTAPRWRSLSLHGVWDTYSDDYLERRWEDDTAASDELHKLMEQHHLILPRLQELHLSDHEPDDVQYEIPYWVSSRSDFEDVHHWVVPNLRILRCNQHIPPPSFPLRTFSVFDLHLMLRLGDTSDQITDLLKFMDFQPNITELILKLDGHEFDIEDEPDIGLYAFRGITSFQYSVSKVTIEIARHVYGPILDSLMMPNLKCFTLSVELLFPCGTLDEGRGVNALLRRLLPDPSTHLLLTTVIINIQPPPYKSYPQKTHHVPTQDHEKLELVAIPLAKLPHVSSLSITTFGRLSFRRRRARTKLYALRELQIRACPRIDVDGLRDVVQSLKNIKAWDGLERVVVRNCDLLDYEGALKVVGKEKLCYMDE